MLVATLASFIAIGFFSLMPVWALGVMCLVIFGWLSAVSSLLQYTLIQTQTPEGMLGRINGLWTAQNVTGDAIGAAILGGMGAIMTPVASASSSGFVLAMIGAILLVTLVELRRFRQEVALNDGAA
ncbi:Enterobactin exporter EntS [Enterobacter hormaechei]|nr:Enterobactin exporter EntS [Enterobacter hormaechei]